MIILAALCLTVVAVIALLMLTSGIGAEVTLSTFAGDFSTRALWIFVAGALSLLLAEMGVALLRSGTRRKVDRRRELKRLRRLETEAGTRSADTDEERERFERGERYTRPTQAVGDAYDEPEETSRRSRRDDSRYESRRDSSHDPGLVAHDDSYDGYGTPRGEDSDRVVAREHPEQGR